MNGSIHRILIFADETADWKVAGLRQLDRLLLAIDRSARETQTAVHISIHSLADQVSIPTPGPEVKLKSAQLKTLEEFKAQQDLVAAISTRLVPTRNFFSALANSVVSRASTPALIMNANAITTESIDEVEHQLREIEDKIDNANRENGADRNWGFLRERSDIVPAEKRLLREMSKLQDGFIARALNRPLSRMVSRWLLQFPLLPNHWTVLLGVIGLVALMFLIRGDYLGFAIGAVLFQLYSALDGCDGEIARVRYLESESGRKLDQLFDRFAGLLFVICLGIGLSRQAAISDAMRGFYVLEAVISVILIGVFESFLTRIPLDEGLAANRAGHDIYSHYATRHRETFNEGDQLKLWMIKHSGLVRIGTGITSFVSALTKRDVFNFVFMLIIVCGRPSWVLHIIAACACAIMILAIKNLLTTPLGANHARLP
jgi:CDP-alcohol phosphatidyltransferase